jgi:serine protease
LGFIVDLGFRDYSLSRVSARSGQDHFAGGTGTGQRFIDLELGWTLSHEDIVARQPLLHGTIANIHQGHGTSVLGIVCAVDNTVGCIGIVPNIASVDVVSHTSNTLAEAIMTAISHLNFGDVLLLEAQIGLNGTQLLGPIEVNDAEFEAIRLATARGIIVVEVGGNGTNNGGPPPLNMDTFETLSGKAILNRHADNPDFRDSGAIMVTAATSTVPHTRLSYAPHGRRIDCYAWGENIDTLDSNGLGNTTLYRPRGLVRGFGGTSGASAIIAGAALAVQGLVEARSGSRLSPWKMREILSSAASGTAPSPAETTQISVMPNLRAFIETVLKAAGQFWTTDGRLPKGARFLAGHLDAHHLWELWEWCIHRFAVL